MSFGRDRLKALFKSTKQTYLGAHFSIAGGLHKALFTAQTYGCSAVQLFTKNATTWKERQLADDDIHLFKQAVKDTRITRIASHTSYLINLATPDRTKWAKAKQALTEEMIRSDALGIPFVVHHPGFALSSHKQLISCILKMFHSYSEPVAFRGHQYSLVNQVG